jgi:UDP-N-acetylmuramate--alanine ligase
MVELCDLFPTFIIGGELNDVGGNAKNGSSNIVICEADESDRSMGLLKPRISVVTNIEEDHLDNFIGIGDIKNLFEDYLGKLGKDDHAVLCGDDYILREISSKLTANVHLYGLDDVNNAVARNFELSNMGSSYTFSYNGKDICRVNLKVPGKHNIINSLAAMSVAHLLDLDLERAANSLKNFSGVQRRFEIKGNNNGVLVVDDYAHHPTEVKATLTAAKIQNVGRVVAIFQPHRYSRVQALYRQFGDAFDDADLIIITDIYSAGEKPIPGVNSKLIVDTILSSRSGAQLAYLPKLKNMRNYLREHLEPGDMLLTMGAGDVWQVGEEYLET